MSQYLPQALRKRPLPPDLLQPEENNDDENDSITNGEEGVPPPAKRARISEEKGFFDLNSNCVNKSDEIDDSLNLASCSYDQEVVASHYNELMQNSHFEREQSKIIQSRKLHNWIKSVLLSLFLKDDSVVLDIGGGKGGDLFKYKQSNISELVLVDHALNSLKDGIERYNDAIEKGSIRYPLHLICMDAFNKNLDLIFNKNNNNIVFDIVSSQFVIHYAFETKSRVLALLHNITKRLRPDGYFIGTTPDANVLIKKWRNNDNPNNHEFGNDNYSVKMDYNHQKHGGNKKLNISDDDVFGIRYFFRLSDAINDCPEYLLHFPTFVKMASEEPFNLELVLEMNFHEFFVNFCQGKYNPLLRRLKVIDPDSKLFAIGNNMWDIAYLYKVFAFRKRKSKNEKNNVGNDRKSKQRKTPNIKRLTDDDIQIY